MPCIPKLGKQARSKAHFLPMVWLTRTVIHLSQLLSLGFWAKHISEEKKLKSGFWCHLRKRSPSRESIYCEFHYVVILFLFSIHGENISIAYEDLMSEVTKQELCTKPPYVCFLTLLWKCKRKKRKKQTLKRWKKGEVMRRKREE